MNSERKRLTKIYTRTGDQGKTKLVGGQTVDKSDPRLEAYGTVDELSSFLGAARALNLQRGGEEKNRQEIDTWLEQIQQELFDVGADLATRVEDRWTGMRLVGEAQCLRLEQNIDTMNATLGPLKEFILPGGGPLGAQLHIARTVCRRAERAVVCLARQETVDSATIAYLNRLSDFLFVLARWAALSTGHAEELWRSGS